MDGHDVILCEIRAWSQTGVVGHDEGYGGRACLQRAWVRGTPARQPAMGDGRSLMPLSQADRGLRDAAAAQRGRPEEDDEGVVTKSSSTPRTNRVLGLADPLDRVSLNNLQINALHHPCQSASREAGNYSLTLSLAHPFVRPRQFTAVGGAPTDRAIAPTHRTRPHFCALSRSRYVFPQPWCISKMGE